MVLFSIVFNYNVRISLLLQFFVLLLIILGCEVAAAVLGYLKRAEVMHTLIKKNCISQEVSGDSVLCTSFIAHVSLGRGSSQTMTLSMKKLLKTQPYPVSDFELNFYTF